MAFDGGSAVVWVEPGGALGVVGDGDRPVFFVDVVVVKGADKVEGDVFGGSAVQVLLAVVGFRRMRVAGREGAAAVADGEQSLRLCRGDADFVDVVQDR